MPVDPTRRLFQFIPTWLMAVVLLLVMALSAQATSPRARRTPFTPRGPVFVAPRGGFQHDFSRGTGLHFSGARGFDSQVIARRVDARGNEIEIDSAGRKFVNGIRVR